MSLDPHPTARELRAMMVKKGVALPPSRPRKARSARNQPSVRPWHPYRSKWEAGYAAYLSTQKALGLIAGFEYEPERLEIGVRAFYTPDFLIRLDSKRIEWREVKGYKREAAMVRLKAAALKYPHWRFVLVTKRNGQWIHTPIVRDDR
jgi:hypothetical protein